MKDDSNRSLRRAMRRQKISHRILIRPTIRFLHCFLTIVLQNIIRSAVSAFHGLARTICLIPILKISPAKLLWLISAFL